MRIHDENAPLANALPGKQLHQRNKSTPALPSLMQNGAQRAVPKRTAFADVSNTTRTQPAQDDSAINGKGKANVELQKPAALLKPATRALAPKTTVQTTTAIPVKAVTSSIPAPQGQPAATRKVTTKRSASVLKDATQTEQVDAVTNLPVEHEDTAISVPIAIPQPDELNDLDVITEESIAAPGPVQPVGAPFVPSSVEDHYILAFEHQAQTLEMERNAAVETEAQVIAYEPEEEEEDELEFEPDEFTRTLNGGAATATTVVLAPRYTKKVQQELEDAKGFVESARTQDDIDEEQWDTSMVAEYGEEIFEYMRTLEVSSALLV